MRQILNMASKWSWLALGVGGILLAIVSTRVMNRPATEPEPAPTETVDSNTESPSGLLTPEDLKFSENSMESKPPTARMPPIEIRREPEESGRRPQFNPKVESKADGIPAIKDIPPLQLDEPRGLDPANGQKQAFNEFDSGGEGSASDAWQPPPEPSEPAVPADDFGGGMDEPPGPPRDTDGDIAPEPRDDFDFGGGGSGD